MKPFYILLLITGISVTPLGIYIPIDSIQVYMTPQGAPEDFGSMKDSRQKTALVIIVGAMTIVIGLSIASFGYGRLITTISRTD